MTHDLGVAAQIADRIAVLYGGRVAELGTSDDVLNRPAHPYTVGLLESRLTLHSTAERPLETLPGEPPDPRDHPPGCPFAPRCDSPRRRVRRGPARAPAAPSHPESSRASAPACTDGVGRRASGSTAPARELARLHSMTHDKFAVRMFDLHKSFALKAGVRKREQLQALRGVELDVMPGEAVALVGESGCGKSTLLRVVAGLLKPDDGNGRRSATGAVRRSCSRTRARR